MLKIFIGNDGLGNIITKFDCKNPESRGEVAHVIAEIELIKQSLLMLWDEMADNDDLGGIK